MKIRRHTYKHHHHHQSSRESRSSILELKSKPSLPGIYYYSVQRMFYQIMGLTRLSPEHFYWKISAWIRELSQFPNYASFLVDGDAHCFTVYHRFYRTYASGVLPKSSTTTPPAKQVSLTQWLSDMMNQILHSHCYLC